MNIIQDEKERRQDEFRLINQTKCHIVLHRGITNAKQLLKDLQKKPKFDYLTNINTAEISEYIETPYVITCPYKQVAPWEDHKTN